MKHGSSDSPGKSPVFKRRWVCQAFRWRFYGTGVFFGPAGSGGLTGKRDGGRTRKACLPVASLTKTFTAALLFDLAREGLLILDDEISRYSKEFRWDPPGSAMC